MAWPSGCATQARVLRAATGCGDLARAKISAKEGCLQIGRLLFRNSGTTLKISRRRLVVVTSVQMEIELAVASWRDGSFDAELTFILGAFLQAALRGDRAFMSEIVANVVLTVVLR